MFGHSIYYTFKPFVPWRVRMAVRRFFTRRKRKSCGDIWPIDESAGRAPEGWPGWPDGKKFAFVITHDVEGPEGLEKCRRLAELEMELGFRSCFNFIPEGPYVVPPDLRAWLTERGFEVGVHDLAHDGKLFRSRRDLKKKAGRINRYLKDWGAAGFRAGFMLRNLDWYHDLDIEYDLSTFDTDPFEPMPEGVGTIFPFWIPAPTGQESQATSAKEQVPSSKSQVPGEKSDSVGPSNSGPSTLDLRPAMPSLREGYVELPYTLPQDSTLFLVFQEPTPEIWLRKLDWVAAHGGMALVNVHPDYLCFDGAAPSKSTFPIAHYRALLEHIRQHYEGSFWHNQPKKIAEFVHQHRTSLNKTPTNDVRAAPGPKIWIDLENTPHIPFFNPIIRQLKKRGYRVVLTARDAYQTCEMADLYGLSYKKIGRHFGHNIFLKAWGLFSRAMGLIPFVLRERPVLALNHGSRSQNTVCKFLGIPTVTIMDYEFSSALWVSRPSWAIYPEVVTLGTFASNLDDRFLKYRGIKEDVYAPDLKPDPAIIRQLHLEGSRMIITVRPPATEAHYHRQESEVLFEHFMNYAVSVEGVKIVLLPRNGRQEAQIRAAWPQWFVGSKVIIPENVIEGMNLVWHSDLVVSGGGTMNREAAALGVPVYSIFRGTIGAVDRQLQKEGRLILIESLEDVRNKIDIQSRPKTDRLDATPREALTDILNHIEHIIRYERRTWRGRLHKWFN